MYSENLKANELMFSAVNTKEIFDRIVSLCEFYKNLWANGIVPIDNCNFKMGIKRICSMSEREIRRADPKFWSKFADRKEFERCLYNYIISRHDELV